MTDFVLVFGSLLSNAQQTAKLLEQEPSNPITAETRGLAALDLDIAVQMFIRGVEPGMRRGEIVAALRDSLRSGGYILTTPTMDSIRLVADSGIGPVCSEQKSLFLGLLGECVQDHGG